MEYCCKEMKKADEDEIIDYCPNYLTTIDSNHTAYPIHFCPFCGKPLLGTKKAVKNITGRVKKAGLK